MLREYWPTRHMIALCRNSCYHQEAKDMPGVSSIQQAAKQEYLEFEASLDYIIRPQLFPKPLLKNKGK